ncbi:MAG: methylated-DNA--[protein]-cysteine S-methyltransferase [Niameybacter sp.]
MRYIQYYNAPIGLLGIVEEEGAITHITFGEETLQEAIKEGTLQEERTSLLQEAIRQLEAYFLGELEVFNLPLCPEGTPFMKEVWQALQAIPYGEIRSYKDIAEAVGRDKAYRAVGLANNRNPIPIIIPCHRVVGANGKLVGYAGGLDIKTHLLELEKQACH